MNDKSLKKAILVELAEYYLKHSEFDEFNKVISQYEENNDKKNTLDNKFEDLEKRITRLKNKKILFKNLEEILATNISEKYTNYIPTHNIELIQDLIINKGEDYKKIFELTFLDCVEYIRGTKNIDILDGLDKIDDIIKIEEQKMDKDEIENFVDFIMDYENIIDRKKGRNSKNQKNG